MDETDALKVENSELKKETESLSGKHIDRKEKAAQLETTKKEIAEELN